MKRILVPLSLLLVAAVACNKSETIVEEPLVEIGFKSMATKAAADDIVAGTVLPSKDWKIFVTASAKYADASVATQALFTNVPFVTDETATPLTAGAVFKANPAQYYPLGSRTVDFIAYAAKEIDKPVAPTFAASPLGASDMMTFSGWDTYTRQQDLLYANLNGCTTQPGAQALTFKHAQAQIVIQAAKGATSGVIKITKVELLGLQTTGNFVVDNTKQTLEVSWNDLDTGADKQITNLATSVELTPAMAQVGDALLVPQQAAKNIKIYYKIGTDDREWDYTYNNTRSAWMMGNKYIYQFTMTANEITFTETVTDWLGTTITPAL